MGIRLNYVLKFRILHIINHFIAFSGITAVVYIGEAWWLLIGLFMTFIMQAVGIDVALHRYYSHKSFKTTKLGEKILLWLSVPTSVGSPAMWCSVHRLHHVTSDTDKDPHDPQQGILKTWFMFWRQTTIPKRFVEPFLNTKELKFVHHNYFTLNYIILFSLMLIDWKVAVFFYALPAIGCVHGAAAIAVLPHLFGYRRYDVPDKSHNNVLASILSSGEGWHNNHHANPGKWKQGETWWELDPPAFFIKHFFMVNENGILKNDNR